MFLDVLFYLFAFVTLFAAVLMVVSPNAVNGAFCMIVAFLGTAALFVLLEAYFLAVLQVLVYAGAVMVLFLFIIMLLDVESGEQDIKPLRLTSFIAAVVGLLLLVTLVGMTFVNGSFLPEPEVLPVAAGPQGADAGFAFTTSAKSFGYSLFTKYLLPVQVCGFLLLASMLGVIVISRKPQPAATEGEAG